MFVTISFLGSAFTRLATEVVDGTWWSAGVAVGAATGCVAEVGGWVPCGSSRLRRYRVFWRRSPARLCKTARLRRLVTKPPGHPDGFALEVRTTGVLSGWESSRFARVPQQNPRVFSVGKWISTECGLPHYYHLKTQRRSRRDK